MISSREDGCIITILPPAALLALADQHLANLNVSGVARLAAGDLLMRAQRVMRSLMEISFERQGVPAFQ